MEDIITLRRMAASYLAEATRMERESEPSERVALAHEMAGAYGRLARAAETGAALEPRRSRA